MRSSVHYRLIEVGVKLDPARSFLDRRGSSLQPIPLELAAASSYRPAVTRASRASPLHFNEAPESWAVPVQSIVPDLYLYRSDAPRIAAHRSLAAPLRGLHIMNASRTAVLLGESIQNIVDGRNGRGEPSDRTLGMKLERRASLQVDREKTPPVRAEWVAASSLTLPGTVAPDRASSRVRWMARTPGSSFIPSSMDGVSEDRPRQTPLRTRRSSSRAPRRPSRCRRGSAPPSRSRRPRGRWRRERRRDRGSLGACGSCP